MRPSRSAAAFTLLELMIAITMFGLVILIVAGAMRLGFRSVTEGERRIDELERLRVSLGLIESQTASHIPLMFEDQGAKKFYFSGTKDFLRFNSNYSLTGGQKGYVTVSYRVETDGGGKQSLYAEESSVGIGNERELRLIGGFDRIFFSYYYKDPTEEEGAWVEEWTDENTTPEKARLHLVSGTRQSILILPFRVRGSVQQSPQQQATPVPTPPKT